MYLLDGDKTLRSFPIRLGFAPEGHKAAEGDGRTPEGNYIIDRRNPNSDFHLSIGRGVSPGGDIFIHGTPEKFAGRSDDWTWGCIAVTNDEIEDIYAMVRDGTPITIHP